MPVGVAWMRPAAFFISEEGRCRPPPRLSERGEHPGERLRPAGLAVEHDEPLQAKRERGIGRGDPGSAGAELHGGEEIGIRQAAPEAFGKAPPVRIVAVAPSASEDDRVDGAELPRLGGELVEIGNDRLLAGMGDIEPGKPRRSASASKRGRSFSLAPSRLRSISS